MPELFSADWMNELKDNWNNEPAVKDKLSEIGFSSVITCGFKGDDKPLGVFIVGNGECVRAGSYDGEKPDWDMRADRKNWMKWVKKPLNMASMGMAYTMRKLVFETGDYGQMIKTPAMAEPFVKSFGLMAAVDTQ